MEKQSPWTLVPIVDEASDTGGLVVSHQPPLGETHVRWRAAALQHASLTCIGRARVMALHALRFLAHQTHEWW
jgi:hypothetical protein